MPPAPLYVIALAAIAAGTLDIACTLTLMKLKGVSPTRLFQTITSALIGPKSFEGGASTAAIGLALHFFIAFAAATVYYVASRSLPALTTHAILSGLLYGVLVHLTMTFIVLPLSALRRPFSLQAFLTQFAVHMLFVGLPIALVVSFFA